MPAAKQTKPIVKNRFSASQRCPSPAGEGQAQQQFKEHCDLNKIMEKFDKTGRTISHYAKTPPDFGIVPSITLHEAMNITAQANSQFEELPQKIRDRFDNSPTDLVEFIEDPKNKAEAQDLGILPKDPEGVSEPSGTAKPGAEGGQAASEAATPPESV